MAKKSYKVSILIDFLLIVLIIVGFLISLITYFNTSIQKNSLIEEIAKTNRYLSFVLKERAEETLINNDTESFSRLIKNITEKGDKKIIEVSLYKLLEGAKVDILFSTNHEKNGATAEIDGFRHDIEKDEVIEGVYKRGKINTYDYIYRIESGGEIIGALNVVVSLEDVETKGMALFLINITISVISILIIVGFTTFLLMKRVYTPIKTMIKEVKKISAGELAHNVHINVNNELGLLADEINEMKSSIWENIVENKLANPITGLPGIGGFVEKVSEKIDNDEEFAIVFAKMKHTEQYALAYGYSKVEEVMRIGAMLIQEALQTKKINDYGIAQISENRFAVVMKSEKALELANDIIPNFDLETGNLYNDIDLSLGMMRINGSSDEKSFSVPYMSLFVGIIYYKKDGNIESFIDIDRIIRYMEADGEKEELSSILIYEGEIKKPGDIVAVVAAEVEKNVYSEDDLLGDLRLED